MRSLLHRRSKGVCEDPLLGDSDFRLLPRLGHMVVKSLLVCKSWAPNGVTPSRLLSQGRVRQLPPRSSRAHICGCAPPFVFLLRAHDDRQRPVSATAQGRGHLCGFSEPPTSPRVPSAQLCVLLVSGRSVPCSVSLRARVCTGRSLQPPLSSPHDPRGSDPRGKLEPPNRAPAHLSSLIITGTPLRASRVQRSQIFILKEKKYKQQQQQQRLLNTSCLLLSLSGVSVLLPWAQRGCLREL